MSALGEHKHWYSAADLAVLALPGLPRVKRKVNEIAEDKRWALKHAADGSSLARPRAGRGGGLEYHVDLLPPAATAELARRGLLPTPAANVVPIRPAPAPDQLWAWFERQPDAVRDESRRRMRALDVVAAIERTGQTRSAAIAQVAATHTVSCATIWNWLNLCAGASALDRLPRLAPRRVGGGAESEIDADLWLAFKSDYLRPEKPTYSSCWHRLARIAAAKGVELPHVKTLQRKLEREVDGRVIMSRREGAEALRRSLPPQTRTVVDLHAMELVNIDGHKWDVFVKWPDGHVQRPMMVAIQDIYSRKFLGWRVGRTENTTLTRLAFADVFNTHGIPVGVLLDNGRAFASNAITGGAKTRYRFKIRPEDPNGLLTSLGVEIHWALPFRGQSKPIERAFGDLCEHGSKHPAFAGAYTGPHTQAKPDNYGSKAVDLDVFIAVSSQVMRLHNARIGRRTETTRGGSFDQAFAESYERSTIRKATPEHLRMALLAADQVTADRQSGAIHLYDNRYWAPELADHAATRVTVRFDPDDLSKPVHVYDQGGRFIVTAEAIEATGFLDVEAAKKRAKFESDHRAATRRLAEAEMLLTADQVAALLPPDDGYEPAPAAAAIRPVRHRGTAAAAQAARPQIIDRLNIDDFAPAREARAPLRLVE